MTTFKPWWLAVLLPLATACSLFQTDPISNPNAPDLNSVLVNATPGQIAQLGVGVQAAMRNGYSDYCIVAGTFGRELYNLTNSDQRWVGLLLGVGDGGLDPSNFDGGYADYAITRRRALVLEQSANNTASLTAAQKMGVAGFANTVKAFAMLHMLNMQGSNGIRIAVDDSLKPGPFVSYAAGMAEIRRLLDLGATQLRQPDAAFPFPMTDGYQATLAGQDFSTPVTFLRFNRALAARVSMYQSNWATLRQDLTASFLDLAAPLSNGPYFTYAAQPDVLNPFFQILGAQQVVSPHPSFVADAEPDDNRVFGANAKVRPRPDTLSVAGVSGNYDAAVALANNSPRSILRNEELVLMYAEANAQTGNNAEAVRAINLVRTVAGLPNYAGATPAQAPVIAALTAAGTATPAAAPLIAEILQQRRYALWYEGHRMWDVRRYRINGTLPLITSRGEKLYPQNVRPVEETNWDNLNR